MKGNSLKFRVWDPKDRKWRNNCTIWNDGSIESGWGADKHNWIIMLYAGLKDVENKEIYEGDIIEYYTCHETHTDAVDMFGVEPRHNWEVHEVYLEKEEGVVEFKNGRFEVNGQNIYFIWKNLWERLVTLHHHNLLDLPLKDFIRETITNDTDKRCKEVFKYRKIIGNKFENPKLYNEVKGG